MDLPNAKSHESTSAEHLQGVFQCPLNKSIKGLLIDKTT